MSNGASAELAAGARAVVGYSDAGFGEGAHVVEHVQGGIDEPESKAGDDAAGQAGLGLQQGRLDVQEIGTHVRAELFGVAGDDFCGFVVQQDEAAVVGGGDDGADCRADGRLPDFRRMAQKGVGGIAKGSVRIQQGAAQLFGGCAEGKIRVGFSQGKAEKRAGEREVFGLFAAEVEGRGRRQPFAQVRHGDFCAGMGGEGSGNLRGQRAGVTSGEAEQGAVHAVFRLFVADDACQLDGDLLQIAEAVYGLGEVVDAMLAALHRRMVEVLHGMQIEVEGFVGDFGRGLAHVFLMKGGFDRGAGKAVEYVPGGEHGFEHGREQ